MKSKRNADKQTICRYVSLVYPPIENNSFGWRPLFSVARAVCACLGVRSAVQGASLGMVFALRRTVGSVDGCGLCRLQPAVIIFRSAN